MACKINKTQVTKYKVRLDNSSVWMEATLESWDGGGVLDIQSDYGNWGYRWGATGAKDFREFLVKLGLEYLFSKLSPSTQYVFDEVATCTQMKKEVIQARKNNRNSNPDLYREVFDLVAGVQTDVFDERHLYDHIQDGLRHLDTYAVGSEVAELPEVISECGLSDMSCLTIVRQINPTHKQFWNDLWAPLVEHWKKELEDEQPAEQ